GVRAEFVSSSVGAVYVLAALVAVSDREVIGLSLGLAISGFELWLFDRDLAARFTGVLVTAVALVTAGVDRVYLVDDLSPDPVYYRMNTVFKFYNQAWTMFAIAAAVLLASIIRW